MVDTITTAVLRCDCRHCDESFGDLVRLDPAAVERLACLAGWRIEDDRHYCPACVKHRTERLLRDLDLRRRITEEVWNNNE